MRRAPAAAAFSMSSTPLSRVFCLFSVTGGCWTTATLCVPARLGMAHRVIARPSEHARQVFAELPTQPPGGRDERVEVDPQFNALPAEQVDEVLRRDVAGCVGREWATAGAADGRVQRRDSLLESRDRVRVAGVARVVEVGADCGAK